MSKRVHHPIFARMYHRMSAKVEASGVAEHRQRMLAGLVGRVVEVGAGNGLNFSHYPNEVREVIAVEPESYLRTRAELAASKATIFVRVVDGVDRIVLKRQMFCVAIDNAHEYRRFRRG